MAYIYYNPNPARKSVGDCVVRALCKLLCLPWEEIYMAICNEGLLMYDMPSSNAVWGNYLIKNGYRKILNPYDCANCYTVRDFCVDFPVGRYLLVTDGHAIAVIDGDYYDTSDSGDEYPIYYWAEGETIWL